MDNQIITIYEDTYCDLCENQLTSENTDAFQHIDDNCYCNRCWDYLMNIGGL